MDKGHQDPPNEVFFFIFSFLHWRELPKIALVCKRWKALVRLNWRTRTFVVDEFVTAFGCSGFKKRLMLSPVNIEPGGFVASPKIAFKHFLGMFRSDFGNHLRSVNLTGVAVTNKDLCNLPNSMPLQKLFVAPLEELISLISIKNVAHLTQLTHLRFQGFCVVVPSDLDLLFSSTKLSSFLLESHPSGWRLDQTHLQVFDKHSAALQQLNHLRLNYGSFRWRTLKDVISKIGANLRILDLREIRIYGIDDETDFCNHVCDCSPFLEGIVMPLHMSWNSVERLIVRKHETLKWIDYDFARFELRNLFFRCSSEDVSSLSNFCDEDIDNLKREITRLTSFNRDCLFATAAMHARLVARSILFDATNMSIGCLEYVLMQYCELERSVQIGFEMIPVFKTE